MSWHDKDNDSSKDPWGGQKPSGPPDLDELFSRLLGKFNAWVGAGGPKNGGDGSSQGALWLGLGFVGVVLAILWGLSGFYIVAPAEEAVVTRFGKYHRTEGSGLHWLPAIIERKQLVNVQEVSQFSYTAHMLTKDENILSVSMAVQYRILDPKKFLFNVDTPIASLQQATASALRQVIGHTSLDNILTIGRETVRSQMRQQLESILDIYQTGLTLTDVVMQPAKPPEEVRAAFDDAIKAQEDEQRYVNQAQAYARGVVPIAEGNANRILQAAEGYKEQRVLQAQGEVAKFDAILPEYNRAPSLFKERLYLDTMSSILSQTNKILVDVPGQQNLLYLPLDKLLAKSRQGQKSATQQPLQTIESNMQQGAGRSTKHAGSRSSTRLSRDQYPGRGEY